jgi:hypothetical protein
MTTEISPHLLQKLMYSNFTKGLSALLYIISLTLPGFTTPDLASNSYTGIYLLIIGPIGLFAGEFSWLANIFYLLALSRVTNPSRITTIVFSVMAVLISLIFAFGKTIAVGSSGMFPYNLSYGYYFWVAAMGLMVVSSIIGSLTHHSSGTPNGAP